MGDEINRSHFNHQDFIRFQRSLSEETALLKEMFRQEGVHRQGNIAGLELEAWLIDEDLMPTPINEVYLDALDSGLVSPELARFNIELNTPPRRIEGRVFSDMLSDLDKNWNICRQVAMTRFDADLVMIGILPTLSDEHLTLDNMSRMLRYRALNEQVMRLRHGIPMKLDIKGEDHLVSEHHNVMLEAATTSFQVHLQVDPEYSVRYYNASMLASAATVAVSANSPYLFGQDLWDETRIPLFEQSVATSGIPGHAGVQRVGFGTGYARDSLLEAFEENLEHFPVLLPMEFSEAADEFRHLRLHNGTIWRWNRPLIGFDEQQRLHLRIEHRVIPAGPSMVDMIANQAFYYGLSRTLATMEQAPEHDLDFNDCRNNFYQAARYGLDAEVQWLHGRHGKLHELLREQLLPLARQGLEAWDIDADEVDQYMQVIEERLAKSQTGCHWQRQWVSKNGNDMSGLVQAYIEQQNTGKPVSEWSVQE